MVSKKGYGWAGITQVTSFFSGDIIMVKKMENGSGGLMTERKNMRGAI